MKRIVLFVIFPLFIFSGCGKPQANQPVGTQEKAVQAKAVEVRAANTFQPFVVYKNKGARENHFVASGFMPDGKCVVLDDASLEECYEGKTCIKVVYDVACSLSGQKWGGIYWLNPANNWGSRKGGFNLAGAKELTFWAKGKKGGERIEEFKVGGITGDYPDSDMAVIGPVVLTNAWKKYSIDLRGKDLSYISGGFAWSTSVDVNPGECTFYLDNIQYE